MQVYDSVQNKAKPIVRWGRKATGPYGRIAGLPGRAARFVFFRSFPPKDPKSAVLASSMEGTRDVLKPDFFY
jgi:hypothetical protein